MPASSSDIDSAIAEVLGDECLLRVGDYTVDYADRSNWTLRLWRPKNSTPKDPNPVGATYSVIGYYGGMEFACRRLFDELIGTQEAGTVQRLAESIVQAKTAIVKAVEGISVHLPKRRSAERG